jgi:lipid A 3-O-deacylase
MKLGLLLIACCLGILSYSDDSVARGGISFATGHGTKQVRAKRLSLQRAWSRPFVTANNRAFDGYWELGVTRLDSKQVFSVPANNKITAVTLAGVIRLSTRLIYPIYLDLGIGLANLSKQEIATRELGSRVLFEDRIGVGILLGNRRQLEIGYRAVHFSNAYLSKKNHSLNLHLLVFGYWFN